MQHQHSTTDGLVNGPQSIQPFMRTWLATVPGQGFGKEMFIYPLDCGTNVTAAGGPDRKASDIIFCSGGVVSLPEECAKSIKAIEEFEKKCSSTIPEKSMVVFSIGSCCLELNPDVASFLHIDRKVGSIATHCTYLHMEGHDTRPASPLPIVFSTQSSFGYENKSTVVHPSLQVAIVLPLHYGYLSEKRMPTSVVTLDKPKVTFLKDCTQKLTANSSYLKGDDYTAFPAKLCCPVATSARSKAHPGVALFTCDISSHVDSPSHFFDPAQGARTISDLVAKELFAPAVIVDISHKVPDFSEIGKKDSRNEDLSKFDVLLTVEDLQKWEQDCGRTIPSGAIVCMKTGWSELFNQEGTAYNNFDKNQVMHFPGFDPAAAKWLVENRNISGLAVDTLSTDIGSSTTYQCHRTILGKSLFNVENLDFSGLSNQNGDKMFNLIVAPLKIRGAPEAPCRCIAVECRDY